MSMSEFDRQWQETDDDDSFSCLSLQEKDLPDDFSDEDIAFAQELDSLFSVSGEELPPYFVQTLLDSEQTHLQAVEDGFEQKTCARVFRQLKLKRRLFRSPRSRISEGLKTLPMQKPLMAIMVACMLFMLVTMFATSSAFASGLALLWSGAHSGVLLVKGYPTNVTSTPTNSAEAAHAPEKQMTLQEVQGQLSFQIYWPQFLPHNFSLNEVHVYQPEDQDWSDGPILELNYDYAIPGVTMPAGRGRIAIREFKPRGNVFQVVQDNAVHQMQVDDKGNVATYIDGQWVRVNKFSHEWIYGTRSELIYEHNGVIFWVVGDQRDGINGQMLLNIASSMQFFDVNRASHMGGHLDDVTISAGDSAWMFAGDVIYVDSPAGTRWSVVGEPQTTGGKNTRSKD